MVWHIQKTVFKTPPGPSVEISQLQIYDKVTHIAISEFSKTIIENAKYIKENFDIWTNIFDVKDIERFLGKIDSNLESLQRVNWKDKSGTGKIICSYCISNIYIVSRNRYVNIYCISNIYIG